MNILVILLVFGVFTVIYGMLLKHVVKDRLSVQRRFRDSYVYCGDSSEMIETLVNPTPFIVPWLRVESRISPYLRFGRLDNLDIQGDMYHCSLFSVMGHQQIVRRHKVHFLRRGIYNVGSAAMTYGDLTGMFSISKDQKMEMQITVFPKILDTSELPLPISQLSGAWSQERQLLHDPFLIRSIRDYQYGDPIRDIHWPASARMQQLQVKIHEDEALSKVMILINAQTREDQWGDLMDYEQDVIEHCISLAATLCLYALRLGMQTGFATNMPASSSQRNACTYLYPQNPPGYDEALLMQFASLRIHRSLRFPSFLETIQYTEDTTYVILSPYESDTLRDQIAELNRQGYAVSMFVIEEGGSYA